MLLLLLLGDVVLYAYTRLFTFNQDSEATHQLFNSARTHAYSHHVHNRLTHELRVEVVGE